MAADPRFGGDRVSGELGDPYGAALAQERLPQDAAGGGAARCAAAARHSAGGLLHPTRERHAGDEVARVQGKNEAGSGRRDHRHAERPDRHESQPRPVVRVPDRGGCLRRLHREPHPARRNLLHARVPDRARDRFHRLFARALRALDLVPALLESDAQGLARRADLRSAHRRNFRVAVAALAGRAARVDWVTLDPTKPARKWTLPGARCETPPGLSGFRFHDPRQTSAKSTDGTADKTDWPRTTVLSQARGRVQSY